MDGQIACSTLVVVAVGGRNDPRQGPMAGATTASTSSLPNFAFQTSLLHEYHWYS